jgi:long-chain acyl-CoA synthetase
VSKSKRYVPQEFYQAAKEMGSKRAFYFYHEKKATWMEMDWEEYFKRVKKLSQWLVDEGFKPGDKVGILSANRPDWVICDLAILSTGCVSIPVYATASEKDMQYIEQHSEAKLFFVDNKTRAKSLKSRCIVFDEGDLEAIFSKQSTELERPLPVTDEQLATIIYTSGTTGTPKGVMHTHGSIASALEGVQYIFELDGHFEDRYFSFLPLSHVAERLLVGLNPIYQRGEIAFARSVAHLAEDLVICEPTILLCVPRLWEKIYEKIDTGLSQASFVKKAVFALAKKLGSTRIVGDKASRDRNNTFAAKLSDKLVGNKLKDKLGMKRCRLLVTGSAPTRRDVMEFFASFGLLIVEVYGLTENICLGVHNDPKVIKFGSCGKAFRGGEIKIADDGEICFRAPWNFTGYYKNEEATREVMSADGWFHTGDLGTLDEQGYLRIVGRKKELLKTSTGKYVAPVPIEDQFKALPLISEAMLVGDNESYCVMLVTLLEEFKTDEWKQTIRDHLSKVNNGLANHEAVRRIGILKNEFTVESGMLTPTMKLKRPVAVKHYDSFIKTLYASKEFIVEE